MKRNGKVDFLRFIFALFIMFLHFQYRPELSFGGVVLKLGVHGSFGVYFFFIVSGYLLASSVDRMGELNGNTIPEQSISFLVKKYKYYMRWYLIAFVLCVLLDIAQRGFRIGIIENIICSIPNLLLLGSLGFGESTFSIGYYIGASWYISALFIVQILVFPIMRYKYKLWSYVIAPIVCVVSLAFMINGHSDRILRAILPIVIGNMCYEIVKYLSLKRINGWSQRLMQVLELQIFILIFIYMCIEGKDDMIWGMIAITAIGVILSFCPHTQMKVFNHPFCSYLGRLSFPLYLLHPQVLSWSEYLFDSLGISLRDSIKYPIVYCFAIAVAIVANAISEMQLTKVHK